METVEIKPCSTADVEALQKIGRQTFEETFTAYNTAANMQQYLKEGFSSEKLLNEINDPGAKFYLAVMDKEVVGYLKINSGNSQTEMKDSKALEIERIYVLAQYHGLKVGQLLYEKALQIAIDKGVKYIWLGVWEENPRAIRFYTKNGFTEFDKHIFKLGTDEQIDIMMRKEI
ncbi:Protease synthase and sporulation negative regulatory protein PAI 1 [compost metagenome]